MLALRNSGTGMALRALAADWEGGQLVGIRVSRIALIVAVVCGALAGLAGFMTAVQSRGTNFLAGESYLLLAFAVVVVGGVGSVGGTLVVGVGVSALTAFLSSEVSSQFTQAMVFALLFIVLIVRPEGFGRIGPTRRRLSRGGAGSAVAGEGR
jgi:branched-chain amino acid transport system permease protein